MKNSTTQVESVFKGHGYPKWDAGERSKCKIGYHIYLISEDMHLEKSISFISDNRLFLVAKADEHMIETDSSIQKLKVVFRSRQYYSEADSSITRYRRLRKGRLPLCACNSQSS